MAKMGYSPVVSEVRGAAGDEVFSRVRGASVVKGKPTYGFPVTPNQRVTSNYFKAAVTVYNTLTRPQVLAWNAFASTITRHDPLTGRQYHPTGQNVFMGLACKFLQINPAGAVPLVPPPGSFAGNRLTITATAAVGGIVFTASGPNNAPAQTELLLQKLASVRRAPTDKYISRAFAAFTAGSLSQGVAAVSGIYLPAYRFVNPVTGQMTDLLPLPEITVL